VRSEEEDEERKGRKWGEVQRGELKGKWEARGRTIVSLGEGME